MRRTANKTNLFIDEPILALTQPLNTGILNIIRISGRNIIKLIQPFIKNRYWAEGRLKTHHIYNGYFVNPRTGDIIDEIIVLTFFSPRSYTREDMLEIQIHQNRYSINSMISLLMEKGIRYARPGEFTKRALVNGRIDLMQAESLDDYISTSSFFQSRNSLRILKGDLGNFIESLKNILIDYLALCESNIDFSQEDIELINYDDMKHLLIEKAQSIGRIIQKSRQVNKIDENLKISIIGKTNVGKSSLFNALCNRDRAIVSPFPGTTRDFISEIILVDNFTVEIVDTAGIRKNSSAIEKKGISHTFRNLYESNLVFLVVDSSKELELADLEIFKAIKNEEFNIILIVNKTDKKKKLDLAGIERHIHPKNVFYVSAKTKAGIDDIHVYLKNYLSELIPDNDTIFLTNTRQTENLAAIGNELEEIIKLISSECYYDELIAYHLKESLSRIYSLFGDDLESEVLDRIFSRFCIGK